MLEFILDGGYLMYPLVLCSVLTLAVIFDRLHAFKLAQTDTRQLRSRFLDHVKGGRLDAAVQTCEEIGGPVAAVLLVGLRKYVHLRARGDSLRDIEEGVNKAMTDYAPHVLEALEKRLNLLSLTATIAPLLGMTGTVTGMIAAFNGLAEAGALQGGVVAGGIAEALITTAAGLLIAIPAAVFHNFFSKRVDRYTMDIESTAAEMIESLSVARPAA